MTSVWKDIQTDKFTANLKRAPLAQLYAIIEAAIEVGASCQQVERQATQLKSGRPLCQEAPFQ